MATQQTEEDLLLSLHKKLQILILNETDETKRNFFKKCMEMNNESIMSYVIDRTRLKKCTGTIFKVSFYNFCLQ